MSTLIEETFKGWRVTFKSENVAQHTQTTSTYVGALWLAWRLRRQSIKAA